MATRDQTSKVGISVTPPRLIRVCPALDDRIPILCSPRGTYDIIEVCPSIQKRSKAIAIMGMNKPFD